MTPERMAQLLAENDELAQQRDVLQAKLEALRLERAKLRERVEIYEQVLARMGWAGTLLDCPRCGRTALLDGTTLREHVGNDGQPCT